VRGAGSAAALSKTPLRPPLSCLARRPCVQLPRLHSVSQNGQCSSRQTARTGGGRLDIDVDTAGAILVNFLYSNICTSKKWTLEPSFSPRAQAGRLGAATPGRP
jgi:hypothetical protein